MNAQQPAQRVVRYRPSGANVEAFHRSRAFVRGLIGPVGSGKSTAVCMEVLLKAHAQAPGPDGRRHSRWAIIRGSYPELRSTTIATWRQWCPTEYGRFTQDNPITHRIQTADLDIEVLFLAADRDDDVRKLLSLELTGAAISEAREIPKSIFDALTGRVGRYPPQRDGGPSWFGVLLESNPCDTDHWLYRLAEEEHPVGFEFFHQPSGLAADAENLPNLPAGYYERLIAGKREDWVNVYVRSQYGVSFDGKPVFPEYGDSLHSSRENLQPLPGPITVGLDFGLTPAAVFCQRDARGRWLILRELVADDMGLTTFSRLLAQDMATFPGATFKVWGDPAGMQRAQTDEQTCFQILRANGIQAFPAPTNDFAVRRDAVGNLLSRLVDGKPALLVDPGCIKLRKALAGGYCYRRLQVSGERYRDVPDKNEFSHVADALQYAMVSSGENPKAMKTGQGATTAIRVKSDWRVFRR